MSSLRSELLSMARADGELRARVLAGKDRLGPRYDAALARLHRRQGERLAAILDETGWPARSRVGDEAAAAAWLVLQHAIGMPDLQRRGLQALRKAVGAGEAAAAHAAMLEDRIAYLEGRPQRYGTQHDWDESGRLVPWMLCEPERVDSLRASVGLPPLAEQTRALRARAVAEGEKPPEEWEAYRRERFEWAKSVGWLAPGETLE